VGVAIVCVALAQLLEPFNQRRVYEITCIFKLSNTTGIRFLPVQKFNRISSQLGVLVPLKKSTRNNATKLRLTLHNLTKRYTSGVYEGCDRMCKLQQSSGLLARSNSTGLLSRRCYPSHAFLFRVGELYCVGACSGSCDDTEPGIAPTSRLPC
jgi:hypothetical protein